MNELTPLTSKSGESEWPYKGKTLIAVRSISCKECYLFKARCGDIMVGRNKQLPYCVYEFSEPAMYKIKPATK